MHKEGLDVHSKGPAWFQDMQKEAQQSWEDLAKPQVDRVNFSHWPLYGTASQPTDAPSQEAMEAALKTYVEGENKASYLASHMGEETIVKNFYEEAEGIIVSDLYEAMETHGDLVREHLFSVIPWEADALSANNLAYNQGGLFIYIPKNVEVQLPIESVIQHVGQGEDAKKRILIVVDENSHLSYLERLTSKEGASGSLSLMVEVIAKAGAKVNFYAIDALNRETTAYVRRHGKTGRDATINWSIGAMNDGDTILDMDTYLVGDGSESDLSIIGISDSDQVQGIDSKVVNEGDHSRGNIYQHGVVLQEGTLTFNGIGHILKNAKFADAQQESRVMMLSEEARADANPILLIDEFEVSAGHAASVGQIDEEALYYLMSRGLSEREAEYLMIRGFLGHVINAMPGQAIREEMVRTIDYKLRAF